MSLTACADDKGSGTCDRYKKLSEVMSRVDIYKTPMASIIGQGIAGGRAVQPDFPGVIAGPLAAERHIQRMVRHDRLQPRNLEAQLGVAALGAVARHALVERAPHVEPAREDGLAQRRDLCSALQHLEELGRRVQPALRSLGLGAGDAHALGGLVDVDRSDAVQLGVACAEPAECL